MKKQIFMSLVCVASALTIIAFFMPWATVATSATGVAKGLTGALSGTPIAGKFVKGLDAATNAISDIGGDVAIKNTVRGYQIPIMVNDKTSKVAISLAQIFFPQAEDLDVKSYLVYVLPGLGILCAILAFLGTGKNLYVIIMSILSGGAAAGGLYNLHTMDVSNMMVKISIQNGLWYTMYSFLFICITGIAWLIVVRK